MSISATPPSWNDVEIARRSPKRSNDHSRSSHGSQPSNSTESSPASRSSNGSTIVMRPPRSWSGSCRLPRGGGLAARERAELRVAQAVAERAEALVGAPPVEPAGDEPLDDAVELVRGHPAEERAADRRVRPEPAAEVHLVRLPALPRLVPGGRALEADVADPVVRAGVWAPVEREPERGDVVPEAPLEPLDQRVEPGLRLRHAEVAVRLARAGDRAPRIRFPENDSPVVSSIDA